MKEWHAVVGVTTVVAVDMVAVALILAPVHVVGTVVARLDTLEEEGHAPILDLVHAPGLVHVIAVALAALLVILEEEVLPHLVLVLVLALDRGAAHVSEDVEDHAPILDLDLVHVHVVAPNPGRIQDLEKKKKHLNLVLVSVQDQDLPVQPHLLKRKNLKKRRRKLKKLEKKVQEN